MPSPEMGVASDVLGVAQEKWKELWQSESPRKVTVQASSLASSGEICCMCCRDMILAVTKSSLLALEIILWESLRMLKIFN